MPKNLPSPELLRKLLRYEPETGKLFWRERGDNQRKWNARWAHKEAFVTNNGAGYRQSKVFNKTLFAHRVIWAMVYGHWPDQDIDHINGIRSDNRLKNLRSVSRAENMKNKGRPPNNTSGTMGVVWDKRSQKWQAQIQCGKRNKTLGQFTNKEAAVEIRRQAERQLGFHPNHGREKSFG